MDQVLEAGLTGARGRQCLLQIRPVSPISPVMKRALLPILGMAGAFALFFVGGVITGAHPATIEFPTIISLVPTAIGAWFWGRTGGALAGLAVTPLTWLADIVVAGIVDRPPQDPAAFVGTLVAAFVGFGLGWVRELETERGRHQTELELALIESETRRRYDEAVNACSRALLAGADWHAVDSALRQVAQAAECELLLLARNVEKPDGLYSKAQWWVARPPDDPRTAAHWDEVSWDGLPNAVARLSAGEVNMFSNVADLPEPEQSLFRASPAGLQACLEIPIMVDGEWAGHLALCHVSGGREWAQGEVELLQTVADMFSAFWSKTNAGLERDRSLRLEHAMSTCAGILLSGESQAPVAEAVTVALEALEGALAYVDKNLEDPANGLCSVTVHRLLRNGDQIDTPLAQRSWARYPNFARAFSTHQQVVFSNRSEIPAPENERYSRGTGGLQALLASPILVAGEWAGVVAICHDQERRWTVFEKQMMTAIAGMIGSFWQREATQARLQDLIRSKDQFVASVSHELRTPLAVVLGLSSELEGRAEEFAVEERSEFHRLIAQQSREVSHIVEDLLVAARAEEVGLTVFLEPLELEPEVKAVLNGLATEISGRVRVEMLPSIPVMGDPLRFRQILRNLVINAHRYGGPIITIDGYVNNNSVELHVKDDGPGVPVDQRDTIFEAYRSGTQIRGRPASIGLGLTVSRKLARLMGGDLTYRYQQGSVFILTLAMADSPSEVAT